MAKIYQLPTQIPGTVGVFPNQRFAIFGDNLATVTSPGYLNVVQNELNNLSTTDVIVAFYDFNLNTNAGTFGTFSISINGLGVITLVTTGGGSGTGTVSSGLANQLAYYSANGTVVSGLTSANSAMLVTSSSGAPSFTSAMSNLQVIAGVTGGTPKPMTLVAGSNVTIVQDNTAGTITVSSSGGSGTDLRWNDTSGTTQVMSAGNGYICSNPAQVSLSLPAVSAVGDLIAVQDSGAGGWIITQSAGQQIFGNATQTTLGASGTLMSSQNYDVVYLICVVANTKWVYNSGFGNYNYA